MDNEAIIKIAIDKGFEDAAIIDTADIVFDASFRPYCEENLCGWYGANYSCPPDCGTPQEMEQKVKSHKYALVLRTVWNRHHPLSSLPGLQFLLKHPDMC